MAKDWIKMRMDLQSHPKVVRILSSTNSDKFRVIGGLHAVWSIFDVHSDDGILVGYTPKTMDHIIGWDGFCDAMMAVGWLKFDGSEVLYMPDFDTHNGQSAKKRSEDSERKRRARNCPQSVRNLSEKTNDKSRTREEKSKTNTPLPPNGGVSESECKTIIGLYHKIMAENPRSPNLTKNRIRAIARLWGREVCVPSNGSDVMMRTDNMDFWERFFNRANSQSHLTGDNASGWQATLDWLLQESKFFKVLEDGYAGADE